MKVYVDEMPKDCWDCPMHDGENGWCKMLVCYTDYIPKDCPLQSLAEYTKQVRKQVINGIRKQVQDQIIICGAKATEQDIIEANSYNSCISDIIDILDRIQGSEE